MQIINPNYSALNAEQTAAIALNTAHTAGDGSDHADVATNSAARHTQGTDTTLGTMTANVNMGGYEIQSAGPIAGGLNIITVGEDTGLTVEQCLSSLCLVSGAYTVTLPAVSTVAEGANVTIYSTGANLIKVDLNSVDRFILDGASIGDDHMMDSASGAGDYVTVIKDSVSGWIVIGRSGTWTDGGTS